MDMDRAERATLRRWGAESGHPVSVRFRRTPDSRAVAMEGFLERLSREVPLVHVLLEETEEMGAPAFYLGAALKYHAAPSGGELEPFLEGLSMVRTLEAGPLERSVEMGEPLEELGWSAGLKIYVAPQCPFCPEALRQLQRLVFANPLLHLTVIDGLLFQDMAKEDGIRSVPTVILDDQFRWTGTIRMEEIVEALRHRDPLQMSAGILEDFLKEGNAARVAAMILQHGVVFPALTELLRHRDWSLRLGAMVVVEEIAEQNPELARTILPIIWDRWEGVEASARGDLIYLVGILGSEEWIPRIEGLLASEPDEELQEVFRETLDKLREMPK